MNSSLQGICQYEHSLNYTGYSFTGCDAQSSSIQTVAEKTPAFLFGELVVRPLIDTIGTIAYPVYNASWIVWTKRDDFFNRIFALLPMAQSCPKVHYEIIKNSMSLTCGLNESDSLIVKEVKQNREETTIFKSQHRQSRIQSYQVEVEKNWTIHVEESGNSMGIPVVFVHGGPGARFKITDHQWFDPEKYRIIVFQQRGTHKCIPSAEDLSVNANLFKDIGIETLAKDMEVLRDHLGISNWLVFGGSWGSTLGLYYAQEYRERCLGLVIRGIFLSSEKELQSFFTPEKIDEKAKYWNTTALKYLKDYAAQQGLDPTPEKMTVNYRKMIVEGNDFTAARLWRAFEKYIENDDPEQLQRIVSNTADTSADERSVGLWETQMFSQIIEKKIDLLEKARMQNIAKIPIKIVQGGKDSICPPVIAKALFERLTQINSLVSFSIIEEGKHSPYSHPGMIDALVRATDQFAINGRFSEL